MRKVIYCLLTVAIFSCGNNPSSQAENAVGADGPEKTAKQKDGLTLLKGDFLYLADAAVLQTHREVYGVVIDEKMHELNDMAQPLKSKDFDWVNVEVRGIISAKPEGEEGWPNRVTIKEILNISKAEDTNNDIIKIENEDAQDK